MVPMAYFKQHSISMKKSQKQSEQDNNRNGNVGPTNEKQQLAIAERRRQVAALLSQSRTETEIANKLGVDQSTISRDIQALKEASGQFLHDLAKSDLVFSYQQSIRGVDEVKRRLWDMATSRDAKTKYQLMAYRLIMVAEETKFRLLEKGPMLLSYESLEEKVKRLEKETAAPEPEEG